MRDVNRESITIWSQGIRLAGDIYKPGNQADTEKLPGILLVPGWGGSKKNLEKNYAPHFAKLGFVVLTLDFKSWGESDGPLVVHEPLPGTEEATELTVRATHIREFVNPLSMSEDVRAALNYLGAEPGVMPDNLGIWGTSMGGGLALVMAASDNRIKALVSQMGPVNYKYNLKDIPDKQMRHVEAMVARGELPPFPGPKGSANLQLKGYPDWVAMKRFDPMSCLDSLNIPTMIIDAEEEALFDREKNGLLVYETIKDRLESRYITFPGPHYDMYTGENLKAARAAAMHWFVKHLIQRT
jgi:dienelactone hydrolase